MSTKIKPHLWVTPTGTLRVDVDRSDLSATQRTMLSYVHDDTAMNLVTVKSDRDILVALYNDEKTEITQPARESILKALEESKRVAPPLRPPTDYELIGWLDAVKELTACVDISSPYLRLTKGRTYNFRRAEYDYTRMFTRPKIHHRQATGEMYTQNHHIQLSGKDAAYRFFDDNSCTVTFREHPADGDPYELRDADIWKYFYKPEIPTIAETDKAGYERAIDYLETQEIISDFDFYPGQMDYIARMASVRSALGAGQTGTGKTLCGIALIQLQAAEGVSLWLGPKGVVEGTEYDPAQTVKEFQRFAPGVDVYPLFNWKQLDEALTKGRGKLRPGVYVSYPQAFFQSGAFENIPSTWKENAERNFRKRFRYETPEDGEIPMSEYLSEGIGYTNDKGFTCVYKPSMSTTLGNIWDLVILDEAHLICSKTSQVTKAMIRLQPKFRYAFTATPIPNMVYNIFTIMGWLCVRDWYKGGRSNPLWPYTFSQQSVFNSEFVSEERDLTEEERRRSEGADRPSCKSKSPIISQPTRLLKQIKHTVAFITKEECNPDVVKCNIHTVRVPMGAQQRNLYGYYLDIRNIPYEDPRTQRGVQNMWLRGICADPLGRDYNDGSVKSNLNPKIRAILEKVYECLERGEQCIIVSAFQGLNEEVQRRLSQAGIDCSRIDSTTKKHAREANLFKCKKTMVMLMGIKCAQSYSFENCRNLIIASLEWSFGKFDQAKGRVFRLNSPEDVNVYIVLHKDTIEELMYDRLATKEDAATIVLHGKPISSSFKNVTLSEIMASHIFDFDKSEQGMDESEVEASWIDLVDKFRSVNGHQWQDSDGFVLANASESLQL
jgi:superfamily II DNA or RNA helicase